MSLVSVKGPNSLHPNSELLFALVLAVFKSERHRICQISTSCASEAPPQKFVVMSGNLNAEAVMTATVVKHGGGLLDGKI